MNLAQFAASLTVQQLTELHRKLVAKGNPMSLIHGLPELVELAALRSGDERDYLERAVVKELQKLL